MRTPLLTLLFLLLGFGLFTGCGDSPDPGRIADGPQEGEKPDHEVGEIVENEMDGLFYDDRIVELEDVDPVFRTQLQDMMDNYLVIKNALVAGDLVVAQTSAASLREKVTTLNTNLVPEGGVPVYERYGAQLTESLNDMIMASDLEAFRREFSNLSRIMASTVHEFAVLEKDHYLQYCPMAFDNEGAYWISEEEEIRNPYFGDKMLRCGEIRDTYVAYTGR